MVDVGLRGKIETGIARGVLSLPKLFTRALVGKPIERDGRTLDPQVQLAILAARIAKKKPSYELTVEQARHELEVSGNQLTPRAPALASVDDRRLAGVKVRIYRPLSVLTDKAPGPALVFCHGGGHALGSLDSHDVVCRQMAAAASCTVIAVDYRLAPEHKFPAAADDATAVFRAVVAEAASLHVDDKRIGVCGDSAGGNAAAVITLDTRSDAIRPCLQLLIYPVVDLTMSFPSVTSMGEGFFLEKKSIAWFRGHYLGDGDQRDPRASPWFAVDVKGLPPALVITAGFDPLRDEGDAYAKKLADAGVPVVHRSYDGLFHGFWNTTGIITASRIAFDEAMVWLQKSLHSP